MSDKFLVLWTEYVSRSNVNRWKAFGTEREVVDFLRKQGLDDDDDVVVIPPEALDDAMDAIRFMEQYG